MRNFIIFGIIGLLTLGGVFVYFQRLASFQIKYTSQHPAIKSVSIDEKKIKFMLDVVGIAKDGVYDQRSKDTTKIYGVNIIFTAEEQPLAKVKWTGEYHERTIFSGNSDIDASKNLVLTIHVDKDLDFQAQKDAIEDGITRVISMLLIKVGPVNAHLSVNLLIKSTELSGLLQTTFGSKNLVNLAR